MSSTSELSEQRVTKHFVEKYPHLVTKGPARMER